MVLRKPLYTISVPFATKRANKGAIIMAPKNSDHEQLDLPPHQLRNLVCGIVWRDEHFDGISIENISAHEDLPKSGIRKIIMGTFDTLMALENPLPEIFKFSVIFPVSREFFRPTHSKKRHREKRAFRERNRNSPSAPRSPISKNPAEPRGFVLNILYSARNRRLNGGWGWM